MDQHCKDKRGDHHLSSHKGPYGNCDEVLVWTCTKVWEAFRTVVDNFLGNHEVPRCWHLIKTIIQTYRTIGWNVLLKIHFLHCHFWFLFTNLTDNSDNHGVKLHEEFSTMQKLLPVALKRSSRYAQEEMKWTKIPSMPHVNAYYFCYAVLKRAKVQRYFYKFTLLSCVKFYSDQTRDIFTTTFLHQLCNITVNKCFCL